MLDKIKQFGDTAKTVLFYILAPFAALLGGIFFLWKREKDLETEVKAKEGDEKLKELSGEQEQIDDTANDTVTAYERLYAKYNAKLPIGTGGVQQSGPSAKGPDSGPG